MNAPLFARLFLIAALVTAAGCGHDKPASSAGTGGSVGAGTGGSVGTGTGGRGGSTGTGGRGGSAGAAVGGAAGSSVGGAGGGTDWATCTAPAKEGVPVEDFCAQYMKVCGFASGDSSFADMAACTARYGSYVSVSRVVSQRGCAAYHLCVAGQPGMAATHCPHPAQAVGPCNLPVRN